MNDHKERSEQIRLALIEGSRLAERCGFGWELAVEHARTDDEAMVLRVWVGERHIPTADEVLGILA